MRPLGLDRGLRTERMAVPGARRLVGVLALTETVSFGVLLYAFSVLLLPMERELGASRGALSAALAAAAITRAIAAPIVGGWIDRRGVRWLMTSEPCRDARLRPARDGLRCGWATSPGSRPPSHRPSSGDGRASRIRNNAALIPA